MIGNQNNAADRGNNHPWQSSVLKAMGRAAIAGEAANVILQQILQGDFPASIVDDDGAGTVYVGFVMQNSTTAEAKWAIKKIVTVATITTIQWAVSEWNFTQVWDNRAALMYVYK
jgi:hypothetical protein